MLAPFEFASAYIDDIAIYSQTFVEHLEHLKTVLEILRSKGLTAKPAKCVLFRPHLNFLGHSIGGGVVRPQSKKVEAVTQYPLPTTKKGLRSFLGFSNYYRRFI